MIREYTVGLKLKESIKLDELETWFNKGYIFLKGLFIPEETIIYGSGLYAKTKANGYHTKFTSDSFNLSPGLNLEELDAIKLTIELARELEFQDLWFNPNFIDLYIGRCDSKGMFRRVFRPVADNLQKRLYGGGTVGYYQSSNDYTLYVGTEEEIYKMAVGRIGGTQIKRFRFEGTAQPASSLDQLLEKLQK